MSQVDMKPSDSRETAARVKSETDPDKVIELAKELIRSLDESTQKKLEHVTPESKGQEEGAA